jgi:hypothetical protein
MQEKYRFLDYAAGNWLWHTSNFTESNTPLWKSFKTLALERHMLFDFKMWVDNHSSTELPYLPMFLWAVDAGHLPLLKLLMQPPRGLNLREYCIHENRQNRSPVITASLKGHERVAEFLAQFYAPEGSASMLFGSGEGDEKNREIERLIEADAKYKAKQVKILLLGVFPPDVQCDQDSPSIHMRFPSCINVT